MTAAAHNDFMDIITSSQLHNTIDRLRKRNERLRSKNATLNDNLAQLCKAFRAYQIEASTCSSKAQADGSAISAKATTSTPSRIKPPTASTIKKESNLSVSTTDKAIIVLQGRIDKLVRANNLLRDKSMREVRNRTQQAEAIAELARDNANLEEQLSKSRSQSAKQFERLQKLIAQEKTLTIQLERERGERHAVENRAGLMAGELKLLDEDFFEEIEDIKFALSQSNRLNASYDAALTRLCKSLGIPFGVHGTQVWVGHRNPNTRSNKYTNGNDFGQSRLLNIY